jgi:trimeric autotransporter adhesin
MKYLLLTIYFFSPTFMMAQTITTIAGNGSSGHTGDGGTAVTASIGLSNGVATDNKGNIFICDGNSCVRKVNIAGIITNVAGNDTVGYSGDGGLATMAKLNRPTGLVIDSIGNIFIADRLNNRIRKINTNGIITTIAGNGAAGFSGDGGPAILATLYGPHGISLDGYGNIYIADQGNSRVRKINGAGIITTVAGNGVGGYTGDGVAASSTAVSTPSYVVLDKTGNMYISDGTNDQRVRKVNTAGIISTFAGDGNAGFIGDGGPATAAEIYQVGIAVDNRGNLYIADYFNNRIRKVDAAGVITTIAGNGVAGFGGDNGPAIDAQLFKPYDIAVDSSGAIYIADVYNKRIRRISSTVYINTVIPVAHEWVNLYPNPGKNELNIKMSEGAYNTLAIVNCIGQLMIQQPILNAETTVSLRALQPGTYYVTFKGDKAVNVQRFEKE